MRNIQKRIESLLNSSEENIQILGQNVLTAATEAQKISQTKGYLAEVSVLLPSAEVTDTYVIDVERKIRKLNSLLNGSSKIGSSNDKLTLEMTDEKRVFFKQFCDLIYECSNNQTSAKALIDKMLIRL